MAGSHDVDTQILDEGPGLEALLEPLARHWLLVASCTFVCAGFGFGGSFLMQPRYVATTAFLLPQQPQSAAASALAALGPLTALAGVGGTVRTPGDQYAALMRSATVSDRMIERFGLMKEYDSQFRIDARRTLEKRVQITVGKKDGLITIDVEDTSPKRAAEMANRYVDELRDLSNSLAITEAQQRRAFFERQLRLTRDQLAKAQADLQGSGFNPGALKAEPKAAAESYARLKAEVAATEVKLQALRGRFVEGAPEVQQLAAVLSGLRGQLARAEQPSNYDPGPDYIGKYREYKYQEALFEVYAKQFELARVDESREGTLIQVLDPAQPPEKKVKPARSLWLLIGAVTGLLIGSASALWRFRNRGASGKAALR
jgi:uncharacterized protein involved in exopolysaccharide biosynthesis